MPHHSMSIANPIESTLYSPWGRRVRHDWATCTLHLQRKKVTTLRPAGGRKNFSLPCNSPANKRLSQLGQWKVTTFQTSCFFQWTLCLYQPLSASLSFLSKNDFETARWHSARGKVIAKKWFIRLGYLYLQVGRREDVVPWELSGLQFYNQRKSVCVWVGWGGGKTTLFLVLE